MKTIKNDVTNEIIIKNSRFITKLIKINQIDDINKILNQIKDEYKDATHYCYAYIIDNVKRFNDNGEPSGTAGMPILNVLEKHELNYVLCVVIRYFGGIKLGAGGLVRAYSKSTSEAIDKIELVELVDGYEITIEFDYDNVKKIDYILKDSTIINKQFNKNIKYTINITKDEFDKIKDILNNYNLEIAKKITLKNKDY